MSLTMLKNDAAENDLALNVANRYDCEHLSLGMI